MLSPLPTSQLCGELQNKYLPNVDLNTSEKRNTSPDTGDNHLYIKGKCLAQNLSK